MSNQQRKMMGFETTGDQKVPVRVRDWTALKLALWRSKVAWDITERAAAAIVDRCEHAENCVALQIETEPCSPDCPDRETRMDALVVLNAARMFAPVNAVARANEPYMAPSREYFSEVIAELVTTQLENEALREALSAAGLDIPAPPVNATPALPTPRAHKPSPSDLDEFFPEPARLTEGDSQ